MRRLLDDGARVAVPSTLDPCMIDFEREAEFANAFGAAGKLEKQLFRDSVELGFRPTYTCVNYQTIKPPKFDQHLAWGDTGAAVCANGIFRARTNFEGGPSVLACALTGFTPAYGFHLEQNRKANLIVRLDCSPQEIADWGAIAIWVGRIATGYETVPVFYGDFAKPGFDMLKQLGVALASHGGNAMFHVAGSTPEVTSLEDALGGQRGAEEHVMTASELDAVYTSSQLPDDGVDLVVFAAPQLGLDEVRAIIDRMRDRQVHGNIRMILCIDPQVRTNADRHGLTDRLHALGGEFFTGTCFYPEALLLREPNCWKTLVTNSAKLVNTLHSAGYATVLRRRDECLRAATSGRLTQ